MGSFCCFVRLSCFHRRYRFSEKLPNLFASAVLRITRKRPLQNASNTRQFNYSSIATRNADMLDLAGIIVWVEKRAAVSPAM